MWLRKASPLSGASWKSQATRQEHATTGDRKEAGGGQGERVDRVSGGWGGGNPPKKEREREREADRERGTEGESKRGSRVCVVRLVCLVWFCVLSAPAPSSACPWLHGLAHSPRYVPAFGRRMFYLGFSVDPCLAIFSPNSLYFFLLFCLSVLSCCLFFCSSHPGDQN